MEAFIMIERNWSPIIILSSTPETTVEATRLTVLRTARSNMAVRLSSILLATMQAPKFSQPGEPSEERWIIIELKLLADVGLVGFPNAGKSTLLSVVSAAKPEIADYPFTTLTPNLGIVPYYDFKSFIMADIPGIIEGASEGKGLGIRFLRHIERNSILLFLVAADSPDVKETYDVLLNELKKYNPELLDKKRILAVSKCDLIDEETKKEIKKHLPKKVPQLFISSATGEGIKELKDLIWLSLTE